MLGPIAAAVWLVACPTPYREDSAKETTGDAAAPGTEGGPTGDADPGGPVPKEDASADAGPCPPECTGGCAGGACVIKCSTPTCENIKCPAGRPCVVECTTSNACDDVDCSRATDCTIECSEARACANGTLSCGRGRCRITCSADGCLNVTVFALDSSSFCLDCRAPKGCSSLTCGAVVEPCQAACADEDACEELGGCKACTKVAACN